MAAKKHKQQRPQRVPTKTPHVSTAPVELHPVVLSEYEITEEPLENHQIKQLPAQVQARIDDLSELAQHDPTQAIPELEHLVTTYPHIPTLSNYLSVAYLYNGDMEKATACVQEAYRHHPQYLFAKVNYANLCLQKGEIDKIPGIFNHQCDLKRLYPHRTRFHVLEFTNFAWVMCRYFCAIGEQETAVLYYQMLKQVAPQHPMTKHAKRSLYPAFWIRWLQQWAAKRLPEQADTTQRSDTI